MPVALLSACRVRGNRTGSGSVVSSTLIASHPRRLSSLKSAGAIATAWLLALSLVHSTAPIAAAFCKLPTKWAELTYRMHVQYYVPEAWEPAIDLSDNEWNGTSKIHYVTSFESNAWWNFNFDNQDFAYYGYPDVPGLTQNMDKSNGRHNRSDIHLHSNFNWNLDGIMNQNERKADVRTVSVHEIGHSTGLGHPRNCGDPFTFDEENSAMHPNWKKKWTTRVDDDNGNKALYP